MAGTPIGKVDCRFTAVTSRADLMQQECFKVTFDFFEQMVVAGYATRIALQYGATDDPETGGGSGTNFWDEGTSFGENAFAVYRMDGLTSGNTQSARNGTDLPDFDYYVLIQWADGASFGASPGNPGLLDAGTLDGVAIAIAVREDGGNPWNGTTNNNGADTKGSAVWTAGASVLHVMPISNTYTGGSHTTNKENMRKVFDFLGSEGSRVSFIGTADSFIILSDPSGQGEYTASYFGIYEPRPGLSPSLPLCAISTVTALPWADGTSTSWGTTTGDNSNEGAVLGALLTDLMGPVSLGQEVVGVLDAFAQPNTQFDPPKYDTFPIRVIQRGTGRIGYVGDLEPGLVQVTYEAPTNGVSPSGDWAYFGDTYQAIHLAVAWGGGAAPASNTGRSGRTF